MARYGRGRTRTVVVQRRGGGGASRALRQDNKMKSRIIWGTIITAVVGFWMGVFSYNKDKLPDVIKKPV